MNKGFTLIELIIVIAIIGIIVSVATPVVQKDTTCTGGYVFTHGGKQVLNEKGGGIPCGSTAGSITNSSK